MMQTNKSISTMSTANKRLVAIIAFVGTLLLIPLVAMQFTSEVNWSGFDFLVAGVLLLGTGLLVEGVLRTVKTKSKRLLLVSLILLLLALVWIELAVGLFGTPFAGS
jgi:ABC-type cobalt transport system substrate-binding protein